MFSLLFIVTCLLEYISSSVFFRENIKSAKIFKLKAFIYLKLQVLLPDSEL